jgi:parvulin-like peptidyl-prolyl isomerase
MNTPQQINQAIQSIQVRQKQADKMQELVKKNSIKIYPTSRKAHQ